MKKIFLVLFVLGLLFMTSCQNNQKQITNTLCVDSNTQNGLSLKDALDIANRYCGEDFVPGESFCNEATGTWWINAENLKKERCYPACVVNVNNNTAEINWRCTGLKQ